MSAKKPNIVLHKARGESRGGYRQRHQPELVRGILSQALRGLGVDKKLAQYQFVSRWSEIVGDELAKRTLPECVRNKVLMVRVPNSAFAQELSLTKEVILSRLSTITEGEVEVRDVRFIVQPIA